MKRHPLLLLLLLLVAAVAVGDAFLPYGPFRSAPSWPSGKTTMEGVVAQPPRTFGLVQRVVLRLVESGELVQLTTVLDSAKADNAAAESSPPASEETPVSVGDLIAFHAVVEEPHNAGNPGEVDYATYLRHQGITGQAFCFAGQWRNLGRAESLTLQERMLVQRDALVGRFAEHFEGDVLAIVSAMTLGDRSRVDRSLRELYSSVGASHVLALSGLHMSILFSLLSVLLLSALRRWGRAGRVAAAVLLLLALWSFVFLAGMPVSLQRAAMMFSITSLLQLRRSNASPHHALILALILMLLWNPAQLFDVGLQLSAVSVAAIVSLSHFFSGEGGRQSADSTIRSIRKETMKLRMQNRCPRLARLLQLRYVRVPLRWSGALVAVSVTAQLATFPLVAHYFGRFSLTGFVSSLLVVPAAYVIIFGALLFLALPPLRPWVAGVLTSLVNWLHAALQSFAALPLSSVDVRLTWWGVAGCYALMLWLVYCMAVRRSLPLMVHRRRAVMARAFRTAAVTLFLLIYIIGVESVVKSLQRPTAHIAIYNRSNRSEVHLVTPEADSILTPRSPHLVGNVLLYGQQKVAIVDRQLPYVADVAMPDALPVDVLLVTRGAKGHLSDMLLRYSPSLVVLDGCLSDYYRARFSAETAAAGLPLYDVSHEGALILEADPDAADSSPDATDSSPSTAEASPDATDSSPYTADSSPNGAERGAD